METSNSSITLQGEPSSESMEIKLRAESFTASQISHRGKHRFHNHIIRDIILGFADGLTVPFALTAGLSSLGSSRLVIIGGLAELFSGAISMGLGAYLAAVTERDQYKAEEKREREDLRIRPEDEKEAVFDIMDGYGLGREATKPLIETLAKDIDQWVRFMLDFELKLEKPKFSRAWISAFTIGLAYFLGGLIPMIPYFIMKNVNYALYVSIGITVLILFAFGFVKNAFTIGTKKAGFYGAGQTLLIGVLAAGASYGIVRALDSKQVVRPIAEQVS